MPFPLKEGTVDTVVSTFTLCPIPGVIEATPGIGRALRPGGKLIFFEHGLSPNPNVLCWAYAGQERSEPIPY
jgi:SAM-dependent methyltransferase